MMLKIYSIENLYGFDLLEGEETPPNFFMNVFAGRSIAK
jgi:hypothetical protein